MFIVNIEDPHNLALVGNYEMYHGADYIRVVDNNAYLVGGEWFWVIDISNPENPTEISSVEIGGDLRGLAVWSRCPLAER